MGAQEAAGADKLEREGEFVEEGTTMARLMTGGTAMRPGKEVMLASIDVKQPRTGMIMTTARQKAQMLKDAGKSSGPVTCIQSKARDTLRGAHSLSHSHIPPHAVVVESYVLKMVMTAQMK